MPVDVDAAGSYDEGDDLRWWRTDIDAGKRWESLMAVADRIWSANEWRKESFLKSLRYYSAVPAMAFGLSMHVRPMMGHGKRIGFNVIKAVSDAFVSMVTKDRPKVAFVTEGGDWELQQRARALEKFIEGQFYESDVYEKAPLVVLDGGGIFGTGYFKCFIRGRGKTARIVVERVVPWELQIDEQDGQYGDPRCIYQRKWIDRFVLIDMYRNDPEKLQAIKNCRRDTNPHTGIMAPTSLADQVLVTEAWRRPSDIDSGDGRHVICINGCDLEDEEWVHDWFPFVGYSRQECPVGSWGIPICDDLEPMQNELNSLLMRASRAMQLLGAGHVLCNVGSNINFSKWDDQVGSKIEYEGEKPDIIVPPNVVPPELYAQVDRIYNRCFELEGIPQAQAQGQVPANLKSGKAQEVYLDITDRRMQVAIHAYHHMYVKLAKVMLELARIIVKENPQYAVKVTSKRQGMRKILLREADLSEDEYVLKLWPVNALSDDPGERMAVVEKWADAGWVDPDVAKRLIDVPDIEEQGDLDNASYNAVEDILSEIIHEGRYTPPLPELDLEQAKKQTMRRLIQAWRDGVPEDRRQMLRDFLTDIGELTGGLGDEVPQGMASAGGTPVAAAPAPGVTPAMAPGPGGPPPMGGPPGAPPGQPPPMAAA